MSSKKKFLTSEDFIEKAIIENAIKRKPELRGQSPDKILMDCMASGFGILKMYVKALKDGTTDSPEIHSTCIISNELLEKYVGKGFMENTGVDNE